MKKLILLLLLLPFLSTAQISTGQEQEFDTGIKNNSTQTVTNAQYLVTQGSDGTYGKILPSSLTQTTAGTFARVNFTGDVSVVNSVNYYATSTTSKGSVASVAQTVSPDDNQKLYFAQDYISILQPSLVIYPVGNYSGQFAVQVATNSVQQKFYIEVYKTNSLGVPIASGVSGAPVGSLGVQLITTLESGLVSLTGSILTNITFTGTLTGQLTVNANERIRYHIAAEKVGTAGGTISMQIFSGTNYNSYYDVPVPVTTDGVINKAPGLGNTSTDAFNTLNTLKANKASIPYVVPEDYGAVGNGVTDDRAAIQSAINSGYPVVLKPTTYLISSPLVLTTKSSISGYGEKSIIKTNGNYNAIEITGSEASIFSLALVGTGGSSNNGIYLNGNFPSSSVTVSTYLSNLYIVNFGNAGVLGLNNLSGAYSPTFIADNLLITGCFYGIDLGVRTEYSTFSNCVINQNNTGVRIKGGNNSFSGGQITNNTIGVVLGGGDNDGHSVMSGVSINHNPTLLSIDGVANGYLFDACMLYAGDINISNSQSIKISNSDISATNFRTNTSAIELVGNKFVVNPTFDLNYGGAGLSNVRFFNNYFVSGTIPSVAVSKILGELDIQVASGNQKLIGLSDPGSLPSDYGLLIRGNSSTGIFGFYGVNAGVETTRPAFSINRANTAVSMGSLAGTGTRQVVADANGNLSAGDAVTAGVKRYKALISQTGTSAPTAIVLENSIGTISFNYSSAATYTVNSAGLFTTNKTALFLTSKSASNGVGINQTSSSTLSLLAQSDGFLNNTTLLIEVYP